jgi:glycosyltransferase involved in cell wall biosynthesis
MATLSVVIPCYNEEHYVGKLLEDLTKQSAVPESVFVVDCHSSDKTVKAASKFLHQLPLTLLQSSYRSAASARNTGADAAATDFLLFLDADMRIKPNFVAQLKNTAMQKRVDVVAPRLKIEGHHLLDNLFVWNYNLWIYFYRLVLGRPAPGTAGGAMLIKRSSHHTMGGYNPKLREFDDIDYVHRMWKHKISFYFDWKPAAVTSNRRQLEQGRLATFMQSIPEDYILTRRVLRPLMKKLGIAPKWHGLN